LAARTRSKAKFLSKILWWRRLNEPRRAAAQHENLGAGAEEIERDGAPDIPTLPRPKRPRCLGSFVSFEDCSHPCFSGQR